MSHVRCCECGARRTLSKHPDSYARKPPRCRGGGCRSTRYRVDRYRETVETGPNGPRPCTCSWYHFPHRKGGGYCIHNPNITEETDRR